MPLNSDKGYNMLTLLLDCRTFVLRHLIFINTQVWHIFLFFHIKGNDSLKFMISQTIFSEKNAGLISFIVVLPLFCFVSLAVVKFFYDLFVSL